MKELKKEFPATILFLILLLLGSIYLFADSMFTYPSYIHAWTQTDRLALALNFQENGFDFFHPATYNLTTIDGITQVDFPIHDYLVALFSHLFQLDLVFTFRIYNLVYSLTGLFFLYRTALLLSKSGKRAILTTLFVFTLPFYVYYQNGFIPSAPSFSNFLIGFFFLCQYHIKARKKDFYISSLFLTLAALSRSPFLIFLVALLLQRIWLFIRARRVFWNELIPISIGLTAFLAYYVYNLKLASKYGSMFLNELLYIDSLTTLKEIVAIAFDRWSKQLLSPFHAILLLVILVFFITGTFSRKKFRALHSALVLYWLISLAGVLFFFLAMGKQFGDHDYYYIDTLLPILTILLVISVSNLKIPRQWYTAFGVLCFVFAAYFFSYANQIQELRYTPAYDDRVEYAYRIYKSSKKDLTEWGVNKDDTLLVLDAVSTNMPFTVWGNRGYTVLSSGEKAVKEALTKRVDYVILLDSSFVTDSWVDYPEIIKKLSLVASNGSLSLYKKSDNNKPEDFFQNLIYYGYSNFDDEVNLDSSALAWMNTKQVDPLHGKSYYAPPEYEYFLSFKRSMNKAVPNKGIEVMIDADYFTVEDTTKIQMVLVHGDYYEAHYLESRLIKSDQWQEKLYRYWIPKDAVKEDKDISFYFWNPGKQELYIDNIRILMYQ